MTRALASPSAVAATVFAAGSARAAALTSGTE
jgi:hypothetical protein